MRTLSCATHHLQSENIRTMLETHGNWSSEAIGVRLKECPQVCAHRLQVSKGLVTHSRLGSCRLPWLTQLALGQGLPTLVLEILQGKGNLFFFLHKKSKLEKKSSRVSTFKTLRKDRKTCAVTCPPSPSSCNLIPLYCCPHYRPVHNWALTLFFPFAWDKCRCQHAI